MLQSRKYVTCYGLFLNVLNGTLNLRSLTCIAKYFLCILLSIWDGRLGQMRVDRINAPIFWAGLSRNQLCCKTENNIAPKALHSHVV